MSTPSSDTDTTDTAPSDESPSLGELETEVALLREENQHLRTEHRRLLQSTYRHSALGFGGLAVLAAGAALVFGAVQNILLAIAAIAAFAGILTYYLTPERFVAATVGESVYQSVARTGHELIDDLGLQDTQIYLPTQNGDTRVFIPQHRKYELPTLNAHDGVLVVTENDRARGVALWPTGKALFDDYERTATGPHTIEQLPNQLAEALVEQFELVDNAVIDSQEPGRLTIATAGSAYGTVDRFDHPVGSLLATGLATTLDAPVTLETSTTPDDRYDTLLTCRWEDNASEPPTDDPD